MRVVKVGGRAQAAAALIPAIVGAWTAAPNALVVVHGGGDEVSVVQRALGGEPRFSGGRRVTTPSDVGVVRMVLSGAINKRLAAQLRVANAVGLSGEDAGLLVARITDPSLGQVGAPHTVDPAILRHLLAGGFLPVVSPLGRDGDDPDGGGLNVNGDDAAAAIAVALGADELLLVADVPGVIDHGALVQRLAPNEVRSLIARGVAVGGMAAKLEAACAALAGGVACVRIGDITCLTNSAAGTVLSLAAHSA